MMKLRSVALALAAVAALFAGSSAQASTVIGSQGFNVTLSPDTGAITQAIDFNDLTTNGSQSGGFDSALDTPWGSFSLDAKPSNGQAIMISDAAFGTFSGTIISDTSTANGLFRNILASGTFTPGTDFAPDTDAAPAGFSITLTKSSSTSVISATVVLDTQNPPQNVPEPSSLVLAGLGVLALAYKVRRRA